MPTLDEKIEALRQGKYTHAFGKESQFDQKVSEPDVEQIKQIYSTNPEVAQPSVDMTQIKEKASKLTPSVSNTDLLLGLIPLATSALAGGQLGEGVDVSGKYYGDIASDQKKRQQTLEDKLLELELSRAKKASETAKGAKRFQSVATVDPDTKQPLLGSYDTFTGQYLDTTGKPISAEKLRKAFAVIPEESDRRLGVSADVKRSLDEYLLKGTRVSPETGLLVAPKGGKLQPIQEPLGILNPKQEKDLPDITSKFTSSDLYKKTSQTLASATNVRQLLEQANSGNAAAANSARVQIARMAGEVGALSDSDIERSGGSTSIKERAKRFAQLQSDGVPLSSRDIQELSEIAELYKRIASQKLGSAISALEEDFVINYGGPRGAVARKLKAYIPSSEPVLTQSIPDVVERRGPDGKIYKYKLNKKTGKYE